MNIPEFETKKLLAIAGILFAALLIAMALYFVFFQGDGDDEQFVIINGEAVPVGQLPEVGEEEVPQGVLIDPRTGLPIIIDDPSQLPAILEQITGEQPETLTETEPDDTALGGPTTVARPFRGEVSGLASTAGGQLRLYNAEDGTFYRLNARGEFELLSDEIFFGVESVAWDSRSDRAILEFPDSSNILYNFSTGQQVTLPQQMTEFAFSSDGTQIAYEWRNEFDEQDNWIGVATPDGSQIKFVEPIGEKGDRIQIQPSPDGRYIATYTDSTGLDRQDVIPIGQFGENFKSLSIYGRGFESQWSPDGETLLYSVHSESSERKPQLWVAQVSGDSVGDVNQPLGVETWAHKCTFDSSGSTAYCAVPESLPPGVGWFPEFSAEYPDNFYEIDLTTGRQSLLAQPVGSRDQYTATQLQVSPDGKTLYFVDAVTQDVFSINLP